MTLHKKSPVYQTVRKSQEYMTANRIEFTLYYNNKLINVTIIV